MPQNSNMPPGLPLHRRLGSIVWPVVEILIVFGVVLLAIWCIQISPVAKWQRSWLHWNYASHVVMILLPLAVLLLTRRRLKHYGLNFQHTKRDLFLGLVLFAAIGLPTIGAFIFGWVGLESPSARKPLLDTIIFQVAFSAFGEELLFRGYFQSRLNDTFGRPWQFGGIRFGPSMLIVAILFGTAHLLNPFNPFAGHMRLDWTALAITTVVGLYLGLLREKTGAILAPTIVHAADVWMGYFSPTATFNAVVGVGWALAWLLLFRLSTSTCSSHLSSRRSTSQHE